MFLLLRDVVITLGTRDFFWLVIRNFVARRPKPETAHEKSLAPRVRSYTFLQMCLVTAKIKKIKCGNSKYMLQLIFFISVNFYFSSVSNSLPYITIPKNNRKLKIDRDKKLTTTSIYIYYVKVLF